MNPKTDPVADRQGDQQPSFSNKFIVQIVLLTIIVLAALVLIERVGLGGRSAYRSHLQIDTPLVLPWLSVTELSRGFDQEPRVPQPVRFYMLAGILLTFVICPTVFMFEWRRRRLQRIAGSAPRHAGSLTWTSLVYGFCGALTLLVGAGVIPYAVLMELGNRSACDNNEARLLRSYVQNEILVVGANAFQYRLLPKTLAGGAGSYIGYGIPEALARTDHAEYSVTVKPDSIEFKAESAFSTTDFITVNLDKHGQMTNWMYQGNWGVG